MQYDTVHCNTCSVVQPIAIKTRPCEDGDWNFILHSWMRSYRPERMRWEAKSYFSSMQRRIESLESRGAKFLIACDKDEDNVILGWLCYEEPIAHYVYIKQPYRRLGIAKQLLTDAGLLTSPTILCSHWSRCLDEIKQCKPNALRLVTAS